MADQASVRFARAHQALRKAADAQPQYFDLARDVLRRHDDGSITLLHAMMQGLQEAYEAGLAGKPLPPLRLVQSSAQLQAIAKGTAKPAVTTSKELQEAFDTLLGPASAAPSVKRVTRTAPTHGFAAYAEPTKTTPKRVVRRAR